MKPQSASFWHFNKISKGGDDVKTQRHIESKLIKVKAPTREPGTILRRTDFKNYLGGHGTFYQFDNDHFPSELLDAKPGDHLSIVLHNLHTDQLDEVAFKLEGRSKINEKCILIHGYIDDIEGCFQIEFEYLLDKPLESYILVCASALPDYNCFSRL